MGWPGGVTVRGPPRSGAARGIDWWRTALARRNLSLAEKLLAAGYTVLIETSGERFVGRLPKEVIKIVDVKCPDSGEADTFEMKNLEAISANDEVKFVLSTRRDYEFARDFTLQHQLPQRVRARAFFPGI